MATLDTLCCFDRRARYFENLLSRNRRRPARGHCFQKGADTTCVSFVLPPSVEFLEPRNSISAQNTKILQLQNPAGREGLYSLFRKRAVPVGIILNRCDRSVCKIQRDCRRVP